MSNMPIFDGTKIKTMEGIKNVQKEEQLWLALEICDSGFPGGAFAHSLGLESAKNHGFVSESRDSLKSFVLQTLEQSVTHLLPLIHRAHAFYYESDSVIAPNMTVLLTELRHVDEYCHTLLTNEVSRRASRAQGKCFLRAATEAFSSTSPRLQQFTTALTASSSSTTQQTGRDNNETNEHEWISQCHFTPLFGAVCGILGLTQNLTSRMYLRCTLRDLLSSAARLNILGPLEGAKLRCELTASIEMLLRQHTQKTINDKKQSYSEHAEIKTTSNHLNTVIASSSAAASPPPSLDDCSNKRQKCDHDDHEDDNDDRRIIGIDNNSDVLPPSDTILSMTTVVEPTITSPILEILQARHDVLYARLFNS